MSGPTELVEKGFDATANPATQARRQELGLKAALALHVLLRHARNYEENNAVFGPPLLQLGAAIAGLVETDGQFELRLLRDLVRANRQQLRVDAMTRPLLVALAADFEARGAAGLRSTVAPPEIDLKLLVRWLRSGKRALPAGDSTHPMIALRLSLTHEASADAPAAGLEERLLRAYAGCALFAGRTIAQLRTGGELAPAWSAGHLVRELVDVQRSAPLSFLRLSGTKAEGEAYWGHHAANVAVLALSFGARLGLPKRRLHDLGMSALFHDVGIAALPGPLLGKPASLDERERWAVQANPLFAVRVLLREREVHAAALERALAAYECHLDLEAPQQGERHEIGFCGRVIALCETFDALTTSRPYRGAFDLREALSAMRGPLSYRFDQRLLQLFAAVVAPLV